MHSKPKEYLDILAEYPGLTEFCAIELNSSPEPPQPPLALKGETLSLTNLQKLSWDFGYRERDLILMKSFHFPCLSSFHADNHRHNMRLDPDTGLATTFINQWTHFLCSLSSLHTLGYGFGIDYTGKTRVFRAITNISALEEFHLWAGMYDDLEEDQSVLQSLFLSQFRPKEPLTSHPDATDPKSRGLPMIRSLHLHDSLGDFPTQKLDLFLDALESRWRAPGAPQTQNSGVHRLESCTLYILPQHTPDDLLEKSDSCEMVWENWMPGQLGRIDKLKGEGFSFELEEQDCGSRYEFWQ